MTPTTNKAAWLRTKQSYPYTVDGAPMPTAEPDQVVVRVRAVAINPADYAVQALGVVYENYPVVAGCDGAGEIVDIGSDVKDLKVGDRVAFQVLSGAFQLYTAVSHSWAAKIPGNIDFTQACVLPLAFVTSAVNLFEKDMLALDYPQGTNPTSNDKILFVWGGSSALGSCAIQQARAAGHEVATAAGKHNLEYCRQLGAQYVFDRANEDIVPEIVKALDGKNCAGAFCATMGEGIVGKCAQIVDQLGGNKFVSIIYPTPIPVPDPVPDGVKIGQCWSAPLDQSEAAKEIFGRWLPDALANGMMKCRPEPEIIGQGLEKIQEGVDRMRGGVSAKKIVVEIP